MPGTITVNNLLKTSDGSHTVFHPLLNQHYHSIHGAIQESAHVFINAGLKMHAAPNISILEIGFGTALNCFLTLLEGKSRNLDIRYAAIEPFPLQLSLASELNYVEKLDKSPFREEFLHLHSCQEGEWITICKGFNLKKVQQKIQEVNFNEKFDLVYFDAFGPATQPEMWTRDIFAKIYNAMNPGGILTTYCAKGEVKRTLKKVNFKVENLTGPPGKREMIRAFK